MSPHFPADTSTVARGFDTRLVVKVICAPSHDCYWHKNIQAQIPHCAKSSDNITGMSTPDLDSLASVMIPIAREVNHALMEAITDVETACRSNLQLPNRPEYRTTRVHMTRGVAHHKLSASKKLDGWNLSLHPGPNTPIHLYKGANTIRLLHTPDEKAVPAPGRNYARRFYYTNTPLDGVDDANALILQHKYLMLWREGYGTGEVGLRLVRPIGLWDFGMPAKWDISMDLTGIEEDFSSVSFEPAEDEEEVPLPSEREAAEGSNDANFLS